MKPASELLFETMYLTSVKIFCLQSLTFLSRWRKNKIYISAKNYKKKKEEKV